MKLHPQFPELIMAFKEDPDAYDNFAATLLEGDNSAAHRISAEMNVSTQNSKYSRIINFE